MVVKKKKVPYNQEEKGLFGGHILHQKEIKSPVMGFFCINLWSSYEKEKIRNNL